MRSAREGEVGGLNMMNKSLPAWGAPRFPMLSTEFRIARTPGRNGGSSRGPSGQPREQDHRWSLRMCVASMVSVSVAIWLAMALVGRLTLG
jgi:hypothetical protein